MKLDIKSVPLDKTIAEYIADKVSMYIRVAEFVQFKDGLVFRMVTDGDLTTKNVQELLSLIILKDAKSYSLQSIESIGGPIIDGSPHRAETTSYQRVTFATYWK